MCLSVSVLSLKIAGSQSLTESILDCVQGLSYRLSFMSCTNQVQG